MSVEADLLEAHKRGLRCTGIFFCSTGKCWKVNLRHMSGHYDYGSGESPGEAMADGLSRAKGEQGHDNRPHKVYGTPPLQDALSDVRTIQAEAAKRMIEDMF
jgi:hypothetical protein